MSEKKKWAYLDPAAPRRDKLVKVGGEAAWYWASGLCYCRDSDRERNQPGFIPEHRAFGLYEAAKKPRALVAKLLEAGLWERVEGGDQVVDYATVYGADPLTGLVDELAAPVPSRPEVRAAISAARSEAGRRGGQRSAASRLASKQTAQPSKQTSKQNLEAKPDFASTAPKQTPKQNPGSSSPVGSSRDLEIREIPKENPPPKDLSGSREREVCFEEEEEFLKQNVRARASRILEQPELAAEAKPHTWDEVRQVVKAFVVADGRERGCLPYCDDSGVRAAVALLAAWSLPDILRAVPVALRSDWWRKEPGRPMGHLSPEVIERALGVAAHEQKVEQRRERVQTALGQPRKTTPQPAAISLTEFMKEAGNAPT